MQDNVRPILEAGSDGRQAFLDEFNVVVCGGIAVVDIM